MPEIIRDIVIEEHEKKRKREKIAGKVMMKSLHNGWNALEEYYEGVTISEFMKRQGYFSHSFAKAFWGDKQVCNLCGDGEPKECEIGQIHTIMFNWQYHLQQLALSEDRIKYLGGFL